MSCTGKMTSAGDDFSLYDLSLTFPIERILRMEVRSGRKAAACLEAGEEFKLRLASVATAVCVTIDITVIVHRGMTVESFCAVSNESDHQHFLCNEEKEFVGVVPIAIITVENSLKSTCPSPSASTSMIISAAISFVTTSPSFVITTTSCKCNYDERFRDIKAASYL
ncbi:hypothetical protein MUK42_34201 [Musa troglodytarum]|uniref:Uncharacterized protein n=1 Tax=Musa troglodytarum TaxID=320322 RepID=A0A9E7EFW7_9LILI|nr:hypothetical protein MUK42_34201 [Musa troglodytarum]